MSIVPDAPIWLADYDPLIVRMPRRIACVHDLREYLAETYPGCTIRETLTDVVITTPTDAVAMALRVTLDGAR
ncbi:hypothetical protein ACFOD4_04510 [Pseudoroseomonas globiformis]|uniref:Uncharacterized protein n=1 Tax=Teichococcus globiformis TaxID=2307229 RepID=A0ABV7FY49_9PROT